jgi:hypothetical protein
MHAKINTKDIRYLHDQNKSINPGSLYRLGETTLRVSYMILCKLISFRRLFGKIDESNSVSDFELLFQEELKRGIEFAEKVYDKVFIDDIKKLTEITDDQASNNQIWNSGKAPEQVPRESARETVEVSTFNNILLTS